MSEHIRPTTFHVVITEENPESPTLIERLSLRLDGPLDIPHIVSVLGAKKRAPRSDRGKERKKAGQPQSELLS